MPEIPAQTDQTFDRTKSLGSNRIAVSTLPLVPLLLGAALKVSIIDEPVLSAADHIIQNYINGSWIELISISFIGTFTWAVGRTNGTDAQLGSKIAYLSTIPVVAFIVCLGFHLGFPKFGYDGLLFKTTIPAFVGLASMVSTSLLIWKYSQ